MSTDEKQVDQYAAAHFLQAGINHMQARAATYDKPDGERSMGRTVAAFNAVTDLGMTEEQGWLLMAILKAVRSQQGEFRADNYEDGAAYFGLMGETAARGRAKAQKAPCCVVELRGVTSFTDAVRRSLASMHDIAFKVRAEKVTPKEALPELPEYLQKDGWYPVAMRREKIRDAMYYHPERKVACRFISVDPQDGALWVMEEVREDGEIMHYFGTEESSLVNLAKVGHGRIMPAGIQLMHELETLLGKEKVEQPNESAYINEATAVTEEACALCGAKKVMNIAYAMGVSNVVDIPHDRIPEYIARCNEMIEEWLAEPKFSKVERAFKRLEKVDPDTAGHLKTVFMCQLLSSLRPSRYTEFMRRCLELTRMAKARKRESRIQHHPV